MIMLMAMMIVINKHHSAGLNSLNCRSFNIIIYSAASIWLIEGLKKMNKRRRCYLKINDTKTVIRTEILLNIDPIKVWHV